MTTIPSATPDGAPAPGNPDPASPVWSLGHRNVQGIGWSSDGRMFAAEFGRAPADPRELAGFIARASRQATTAVAGYDLTFTPVKSVSVLWALADPPVARVIEAAHDAAVGDTLRWIATQLIGQQADRQGIRIRPVVAPDRLIVRRHEPRRPVDARRREQCDHAVGIEPLRPLAAHQR